MSLNQCAGCMAGIPVDEKGNHEMGGGISKTDGLRYYRDLMACQRHLYESDYGDQSHPNRITKGKRPK